MVTAADPLDPVSQPLLGWSADWRTVIQFRINQLNDAGAKDPNDALPNAVIDGIAQATAAARLGGPKVSPFTWLGEWVTGSAIEGAWRGLHRAEVAFIAVADDQWLLTRLTQTLQTLQALGIIDDAATEVQKAALDPKAGQLDRNKVKDRLEQLNSRSDHFHSELRNLRNILMVTTLLLVAGLLAMAVVAALAPHTFSLCGVSALSDCNAPTVWQVEIAGGFGGLLSAVVFITKLPTQSTPYTIWLFQGLIKAPTGAALALIVVFLVQTGLVGFLKADTNYVIPYALVFGFAQQAATQVIDNWATGLVNKNLPSKSANTAGKAK